MNHVCRRCLTRFSSEQVISDHIERCRKQKPAYFGFSGKDKFVFETQHMKISLPHRMYADFEFINQPTDSDIVYKHIPIAAGYLLRSPFGDQNMDMFGTNCTNWFVDQMLELQVACSDYFKQSIGTNITPEEEEQFQNATEC